MPDFAASDSIFIQFVSHFLGFVFIFQLSRTLAQCLEDDCNASAMFEHRYTRLAIPIFDFWVFHFTFALAFFTSPHVCSICTMCLSHYQANHAFISPNKLHVLRPSIYPSINTPIY